MTGREVLDWVIYAARGRRRALVANHTLHSISQSRRYPEMARLYAIADVIQIDSNALLGFARLTGKPAGPQHRSAYSLWRNDFWDLAQRYGLRIFYLGGDTGIATGAVRMMEMAYPDVRYSGHDICFDMDAEGDDNQRVLSTIRRFAPDILMVGMASPQQETWLARNLAQLPPCVVLPVGDSFDRENGQVKLAPRWMQACGLGWLHRLCPDPRGLASRCLVAPWYLLKPAYRDLFRRQ